MRGGAWLGRGPRAVEERLLEEVAALLADARRDPRLLALSVRVVVPSRGLRQHVAAVLARRLGAVAGVVVQTLHAAALELLERGGESAPRGEALFPVLVRRAAREERVLREPLDSLVDGYGAVEASVRDLLDAGFTPDQAAPLDDALSELAERGVDARIARALAAVAGRVQALLFAGGLAHRSDLLRRAAELLEERGQALLPARAVFVHGFADATGVASDLLCALRAACGARVLLDAPPDPSGRVAGGRGEEPGLRFSRRLRERLGAPATLGAEEARDGAARRLAGVAAPGAQAEARTAALRVRSLLEEGVTPERIALVTRDPAPSVLPLRLHLRRLGIPFSGEGIAGPGGAASRRRRAFLDLLRERGAVAADRWLDAQPRLAPARRADLRIGLRHTGAARLEEVPGLPTAAPLRLPVRTGFQVSGGEESGDAEEGEPPESVLRRRSLAPQVLATATAAAGDVLGRLTRWPAEAPWPEHARELRGLLESLGWDRARSGEAELYAALDALDRDLPDGQPLDRDELLLLLGRALDALSSEAVGGRGGGVQLLTVMEARGRSFDHVLVLGMDRGVFPRSVREDPLLPDAVRESLAAVLPDLPQKRRGIDEEHFLFAQLVASARDTVTLLWRTCGDDGKPQTPSVFVRRLERAGWLEVTAAESPLAPPPAGEADAVPFEAARRAALHGSRRSLAAALEVAYEERARALGPERLDLDAAALARGRIAVCEELDRGPHPPHRLGPYYGFVGPAREGADPRRGALYVTRLEAIARCPWQAFVERLLRIERVPDPFEALPGIDPLRLGNAVHRFLERVAQTAGRPTRAALAAVDPEKPAPVPWPDPEAQSTWLREAAEAVLREDGAPLPGLVELLVRQAGALLDRARELDFASGAAPAVLGAELQGGFRVPDPGGAERWVRFRADRVDAVGGTLVLTDYKTGKPVAEQVRAASRRKRLLEAVRCGTHLQACAYARASEVGPPAAGRYLYLRPDLDPAAADVRVDAADVELARVFDEAVASLLRAHDLGSFVPRLLEGGGDEAAGRCERCEVKEACLWGDSGARGRLRAWLDDGDAGARRSDGERAVADVLALDRKERRA
jgi:hypothetical protein